MLAIAPGRAGEVLVRPLGVVRLLEGPEIDAQADGRRQVGRAWKACPRPGVVHIYIYVFVCATTLLSSSVAALRVPRKMCWLFLLLLRLLLLLLLPSFCRFVNIYIASVHVYIDIHHGAIHPVPFVCGQAKPKSTAGQARPGQCSTVREARALSPTIAPTPHPPPPTPHRVFSSLGLREASRAGEGPRESINFGPAPRELP